MYIDEDKPIPLYQFDILKPFDSQIVHFISTRNKSLPPSMGNYFTIGLNGAIENNIVLNNRKNIAKQIGISADSYVFASQIHANLVAVVKDDDRGKGAFERSSYLCDIDAMVTNRKGICLVTQAADCVPIVFFDPVKKAIGVAHAGWKGTVAKIPAEVVKVMIKEFGSSPKDIIVGIGPSIGPCCYEVGYEVVEQVRESFANADKLLIQNPKFTKLIFNLWDANLCALLEQGLKPENIEVACKCTKCHNDIFFSARAGDKGRFGGFIMLCE